MSQDNTVITVDANVISTMSMESHDIPSVADIPGVAVPKPKKSKRASQRSVTKCNETGIARGGSQPHFHQASH